MRQADRRRALLPGSAGSGWDFEFDASTGVLPPADKMTVALVTPGYADQSTAEFVNGYYRLTGIGSTSADGNGIALRLNSSYLGTRCEAECAFYIRTYSISELALQFSLRVSAGHDFIVRIQSGRLAIYEQRGTAINKYYNSTTTTANTRYVLRCELDGENSVASFYLNDELIVKKTTYFVMDNCDYTSQVMAVSAGYSNRAQVDIEYFKYRKL